MALYCEHDIMPYDRPIQIVSPDSNHAFTPDNFYTIERLLSSDDLRNRKIVVVSIAGALRKGKSFLLNYFLKYLNAQYKKHNVDDWIGRNRSDEELNGFRWRGGKDPETVGIWMWSEIFTHDFPKGDKVAIILMDTQGIFDNQSSLKKCISIFAISMLLSSVQCYNLMRQVQEDDLTNLRLFTEYARFVKEDVNRKPFQKLMFIVRDWPSPDDHEFGSSEEYVADILKTNTKQTNEMHELRNEIKKSFDKIEAFLMPYPGNDVAQQRKRPPNEIKIEPDFIDCIEKLTEQLLAPKNLIRKEICGETVRASEFVGYLKKYVETFSGEELPEPISILQATAETHLKKCVDECIEDYIDQMMKVIEGADVYFVDGDLLQAHIKAKEKAVARFEKRRKLGSSDLQIDYSKSLQKDIERGYATVQEVNKSQRNNVESKKDTIFKSVAIGLTVAGAVGSVVLGGPLGLGLFATLAEASPAVLGGLAAGGVAGGGIGGVGIGAAMQKWFPRKWFGEQSALSKTMKRYKQSLKDKYCGNGEFFGNTTSPADLSATATDGNTVETAPVNTTAIPTNEAPATPSNTVTLSDHPASEQNSTTPISNNMVADTTTANGRIDASDPTTPPNRNEETDLGGRIDYFYLPQLAVNTIRNFFWNFRHQQN